MKYEVGKLYMYEEECCYWKVKVLENTSDEENYRLKLEVVEIDYHNDLFKKPEIGHIFDVFVVKNYYGAYGMWTLDGPVKE